ncbi:MAG TPA: ASCH domain-containing protein [Armatimonadota bacterium]|nr:ASCH domain-containing protein [Armatimonadota bacterium]
MKAITLWQPWASLIACGAKQIETRSWPTRYRGPLAIHAAKKSPNWIDDLMGEPSELREICARYLGFGDLNGRSLHDLPSGVIVATCVLADCLSTQRPSIAFEPWSQQWLEEILGDFSPGRYAWTLAGITPLQIPVATTGARGLWEWQP